jgi:hypothetical protein
MIFSRVAADPTTHSPRHARMTGGSMSTMVKALIGLAALAFVLAVLTHFVGPIMRTQAEAFSRASGNLALLAIALVLTYGATDRPGRAL